MAQLRSAADLMPVEEYLAGENDGAWRHEYVNGMVYAMAGASERHNVIKLNVAGLLNGSVSESCRVFDGDMKLEVSSQENVRFYYPDIFVSCSEHDDARHSRADAVVIIEVLSPSTNRADRYEKFDAYKSISSLQEYALIEQEFRRGEVFRRSRAWQREVYLPDSAVTFESVKQTLTLDQIYRRVASQ